MVRGLMNDRHLRYIVAVAEAGSFTGAARQLNVSQPTLSQQVRQVEEELGVALFQRDARRVVVTEAGSIALGHARRALDAMAFVRSSMDDYLNLEKGYLRLGVTQTFNALHLPVILKRFLRQHPGIVVDVLELANDQILDGVNSGNLQIGIGISSTSVHEAKQALYETSLMLVCSKDHALSDYRIVEVDTLPDVKLALLTSDYRTRRVIDDFLALHHVELAPVVAFNTFSAILALVGLGTHVSIMPADVQSKQNHADIAFKPLNPSPPISKVHLIEAEGNLKTRAADAFAAMVRSHFSS